MFTRILKPSTTAPLLLRTPCMAAGTIRGHASLASQVMNQNKVPADGKQVIGYALHCQTSRNNTILTLSSKYKRVGKLAEDLTEQQQVIDEVRPLQDVKIALSTGMLGYRNTKQDSYEASFQTAARMFKLMEEKNYLDHGLEIIFRQFSANREGIINALMGKEGNKIRPMITQVTDASKIKFGGHRAPVKRRV